VSNTQNESSSKIALLNESTTFSRFPNPKGEGELLEIKVTTKVRTQTGVLHDNTQSFVLSGTDAADTLGSLRIIHNNLQLLLMKAQQDSEAQESQPGAESKSPELSLG